MGFESAVQRNDRLGSHSARQQELALALTELEAPAGVEAEGDLEVLRLLLVDAVMDGDDYTLRHAVEGLHRLLVLWAAGERRDDGRRDAEIVEARGELRGLHNLASVALERTVPLALLSEIAPDTLPHELLSCIVENPGCSNEDLVRHVDRDKTQVSRAGRRLSDAGLARKRRLGTRNSWHATPRGINALHAVRQGWARPTGRTYSRT